ncbi:MAG TPA: TIGR03118 family protein, partial [Chloroflexota bacterium]
GTDLSTLYDGTGTPEPATNPLQVMIPGPASHVPAVPTGNLFNPTSGFLVTSGVPSTKAFFIFAGATGTISAWNPTVDLHHAILKVNNFPQASYTGIALGTNSSGSFLFAANFTQARIDVFDGSFAPATLAGTFTDPMVPAGFGPFNIENIGGMLFVTYAKINPMTGRDIPGVGNGYVAIFDTDGKLVRHLASQGLLNSPWGMAIAPSTFQNASGDLLVGNFGDGHINVFRLSDGMVRGQLKIDGQPIVIPGLWALVDGTGALHADPTKVYFTAGINHEADGLFGTLGPATD